MFKSLRACNIRWLVACVDMLSDVYLGRHELGYLANVCIAVISMSSLAYSVGSAGKWVESLWVKASHDEVGLTNFLRWPRLLCQRNHCISSWLGYVVVITGLLFPHSGTHLASTFTMRGCSFKYGCHNSQWRVVDTLNFVLPWRPVPFLALKLVWWKLQAWSSHILHMNIVRTWNHSDMNSQCVMPETCLADIC